MISGFATTALILASFGWHNASTVPAAPAANALYERVNASRAAFGLSTLVRSAQLDATAQRFAQDLVARHYFSHTSPDGDTLRDRLADAHVRYHEAGENLALSLDPQTAHDQLLASPDHRRNLLDPDYARIGVGAVGLDDGRIIYVEEFAD